MPARPFAGSHTLKGASATASAPGLVNLSLQKEAAATEGDFVRASNLVTLLDEQFEQFQALSYVSPAGLLIQYGRGIITMRTLIVEDDFTSRLLPQSYLGKIWRMSHRHQRE